MSNECLTCGRQRGCGGCRGCCGECYQQHLTSVNKKVITWERLIKEGMVVDSSTGRGKKETLTTKVIERRIAIMQSARKARNRSYS